MSLDIELYYLVDIEQEIQGQYIVWHGNITHNLNVMADKAGIYMEVWRPNEIGVKKAFDIVSALGKAIKDLQTRPSYYRKYNPKNNWGSYETFLEFIKQYQFNCKKYPNSMIGVCR
jgi:hypothetical protein